MTSDNVDLCSLARDGRHLSWHAPSDELPEKIPRCLVHQWLKLIRPRGSALTGNGHLRTILMQGLTTAAAFQGITGTLTPLQRPRNYQNNAGFWGASCCPQTLQVSHTSRCNCDKRRGRHRNEWVIKRWEPDQDSRPTQHCRGLLGSVTTVSGPT